MFNRFRHTLTALAAAAALTVAAGNTQAATDITGAGSSFVYPVLSKWSSAFSEKTGNKINYQTIGSGGGIAQIKAATVDFGASDKPLEAKDLTDAGLGQFPVVIGGIVPVVNIEGVQAGDLKLTGPVLADIFLGKVLKWNDKAIADLNPGAKLPETLITVVHRSDGSGTSFNVTNYLAKVSPEWKEKVGEGTSVSWPTGVGGKGNEGVAAYVRQIKDSIGYVEYAYALQNKLTYAQLQNKAGSGSSRTRPRSRRPPRRRGLEERQGFQPDHDRRAGRSRMADHCDDLGDHVQDAKRCRAHQDCVRVLPVVVRTWPEGS
jgi:phosphate transport system substrate-binding protein